MSSPDRSVAQGRDGRKDHQRRTGNDPQGPTGRAAGTYTPSAAYTSLSRDDRAFLDAWLVGADFPMAPVVRRLLAAHDDRVEALATLRSAWNAHMETCQQHATLPTIEPPSEADLAAWRDAPSGTASA